MNRKVWWASATAVILAAGLIAGSHPTRQAVGGALVTKVTVKEYAFVPKTITTEAGAKQVTITNAGALDHTFVIDALKVKSPVIKPGQSVTITVNLKKGTYQVYCDVPGHQEVGMVATLTVK